MEKSTSQALPGKKTDQPSKAVITVDDIFKKLLELEVRLKKMEEKITKPLIG